jgi:hypothetical protein
MVTLQDDRYLEMPSPSLKEEQVLQQRFSGGERYYGGSSGGGNERGSHYYPREPTHDDRDRDRDLSSLSNSSSGSGHRRSQEPPEVDRGMFAEHIIAWNPKFMLFQFIFFDNLHVFFLSSIDFSALIPCSSFLLNVSWKAVFPTLYIACSYSFFDYSVYDYSYLNIKHSYIKFWCILLPSACI